MAGSAREAELEALVVELTAEIAALRGRLAEAERWLGQDSRNSSRPPSSDPPKTRAERRREAREKAKQLAKRKPGGQPGHEGHHRQMVADPDQTVEHPPERCAGCGEQLAEGEPVDEPVCRQVWELPAVVCSVTEHRRLRRRCRCCAKVTLADVAAGTPAGAFGANLCATVVGLCAHISREEVAGFVVDTFGCPMSAASVEAICKRASQALEGAYDELADAVKDAPVVHADETGWRWPALRRWAWLASTEQIAVYHLTDSRAARTAKTLLGEDFQGILVSDRYGAYAWISRQQRQACWSHLVRDVQALADRGDRIGRLGRQLKQTATELLAAHRTHQADGRLVA